MNRIRHDERYTTHGNSLVERCIELIIWLVEILGLSLVKLSKEGLGYAAHEERSPLLDHRNGKMVTINNNIVSNSFSLI